VNDRRYADSKWNEPGEDYRKANVGVGGHAHEGFLLVMDNNQQAVDRDQRVVPDEAACAYDARIDEYFAKLEGPEPLLECVG